ncbi:STAS domain-containing protein [Lentzea sp. NPDC054927]
MSSKIRNDLADSTPGICVNLKLLNERARRSVDVARGDQILGLGAYGHSKEGASDRPVRCVMTDRNESSTASVTTSQRDQVVVAVVSGELDMASVDRVRSALFDQVDARPAGLVVDLAVTFLASAGLSMLLELHGRTQRDEVEFAVVAGHNPALQPLMLSGMDQVLPLAESVDDAVATIRQTSHS